MAWVLRQKWLELFALTVVLFEAFNIVPRDLIAHQSWHYCKVPNSPKFFRLFPHLNQSRIIVDQSVFGFGIIPCEHTIPRLEEFIKCNPRLFSSRPLKGFNLVLIHEFVNPIIVFFHFKVLVPNFERLLGSTPSKNSIVDCSVPAGCATMDLALD